MKQFLKNILHFILIAFIPFAILLVCYFIFDPFRVLYKYDNYTHPIATHNKDYISTEMFIKNYPKYHYNSFLLGSSRTAAYRIAKWKQYLTDKDIPYVFDAPGESLFGIYKKLKFMDARNVKIDNVLMILCRDVSFATIANHKGHIFIKHPAISGESSLIFHFIFIKAYFNPGFLYSYYDYKITKHFKNYMSEYLQRLTFIFDPVTNEVSIPDSENDFLKDSVQYYIHRRVIFYERVNNEQDTYQKIKPEHLKMLQEIKSIFDKHHTKYKIVLSPLYEQVKFSQQDLTIFKNIFGNEVYDFSGKNTFTDSYTNYFETSHYRYHVGEQIMKIIYDN